MNLDNLSTGQSASIVFGIIFGAWAVVSLLALGVWKFVELVS